MGRSRACPVYRRIVSSRAGGETLKRGTCHAGSQRQRIARAEAGACSELRRAAPPAASETDGGQAMDSCKRLRLRGIFVWRPFRPLRLIVVVAGRRGNDRLALRIARGVRERVGDRRGMHAIVHGVCVSMAVGGTPETALRLDSFIRYPPRPRIGFRRAAYASAAGELQFELRVA